MRLADIGPHGPDSDRLQAFCRASYIRALGMAPEDPHDRYAATTGELRGWVRKRETPCWAITEIRPARNGTAIFVAGTNNADPAAPEPLRWVLDWHSFRDPAFVERRYDFSGAHFSRGAAAALLRVREEAAQLYTGEVRS